MKTFKKSLALVLALVMCLGCMSVGVWADVTWTEVNTEDGLKAAVAAGGYVKLTGDIPLTSTLTITRDLTLDGGGYTITASGMADTADVISVTSGIVTIQNVTITNSGEKLNSAIAVRNGSTVTLGTIMTNGSYSAPVVVDAATVTIDGDNTNIPSSATEFAIDTSVTTSGTSTVSILGGNIGEIAAVSNNASRGSMALNISGGTVNGFASFKNGDAIEVSGGTINNLIMFRATATFNVSGGLFNCMIEDTSSTAYPFTGGTFATPSAIDKLKAKFDFSSDYALYGNVDANDKLVSVSVENKSTPYAVEIDRIRYQGKAGYAWYAEIVDGKVVASQKTDETAYEATIRSSEATANLRFTSVDDAMVCANNGDVVTLYADFTTANVVNNYLTTAGESFTVNSNNHRVTGTVKTASMPVEKTNGEDATYTFTVKNARIYIKETGKEEETIKAALAAAKNGQTVIIEKELSGQSIDSANMSIDGLVIIDAKSTLAQTSSALVYCRHANRYYKVLGGIFTSSGSYNGTIRAQSGSITIDGGVYENTCTNGGPVITVNNGSLTLNDGKFTGQAIVRQYSGNNGTLTINGGHFNQTAYDNLKDKTAENGVILAEGNSWIPSSEYDGYWTIGIPVTVTFNNEGTETTKTVAKGSKVAAPTTPTKTGYSFAGWYSNTDLTTPYDFDATVTGDITLYAKWEVAKYTVTWSINGASFTEQVEYGTTPTYSGVAPTKVADDIYTYTFSGWTDGTNNYASDAELPAVTDKDVTYTATFKSVAKKFTVTFQNGETTLQTKQLAYGATPAYTGATPTKDAEGDTIYTFSGWSPALAPVTGNVTYTAQFDASSRPYYSVSFLNYDGTLLKSASVADNATPSFGLTAPSRDPVTIETLNAEGSTTTKTLTYTFSGWTDGVNSYGADDTLPMPTKDTTYTATYSVAIDSVTKQVETKAEVKTEGDTTTVETVTTITDDVLTVEETTKTEVTELKNDNGNVIDTTAVSTNELKTSTEVAKTIAEQTLTDTETKVEKTVTTTAANGSVSSVKTETKDTESYVSENNTVTYTAESSTKTIETTNGQSTVTANEVKTATVTLTQNDAQTAAKVADTAVEASDEAKAAAEKANNTISFDKVDVEALVEKVVEEKDLKDDDGKVAENKTVTVSLQLQTVLKKETDAVEGGTAKTMTYEVKPVLLVSVNSVESTVDVKNEHLQEAANISITLPVSDSFTVGSMIRIIHEGEDGYRKVYVCEVKQGEGYKYVDFTVSHFSTFTAEDSSNVYLNYHANGGSGSMASTETAYTGSATVAANSFSRSGYSFGGWNTAADGSGTTYAANATVATLTEDIELYAQWNAIVISNDDGGIVIPTGGNNSGEVEITDEETPLSAFPIFYVDVAEDSWYHDAVAYVTALDLMNGVGDDRFDPNANTTRGMVAVVMMRLAQGVAIDSESFFDVADDAYYAEAAAWAVENGVYVGYDDGSFRGEINILREQFAAVLYRYATAKGYDVSGKADIAGFTDSASVSEYASDAIAWAVESGIMEGVGDNLLDPLGNATRAQLATMLMRFHALYTAEV